MQNDEKETRRRSPIVRNLQGKGRLAAVFSVATSCNFSVINDFKSCAKESGADISLSFFSLRGAMKAVLIKLKNNITSGNVLFEPEVQQRDRAYFRQQRLRKIQQRSEEARKAGVFMKAGMFAKTSPFAKDICRNPSKCLKGKRRLSLKERRSEAA